MNLLFVGGRQRFLVAHHFGREGGQKKPCPPYHIVRFLDICTIFYSVSRLNEVPNDYLPTPIGVECEDKEVKPSSLYISQKSLKANMVGFAIALPTLHNTLIFQLFKYLCLTMIGFHLLLFTFNPIGVGK